MASRPGTITITKSAEARAEERASDNEKRPRNLPPVNVAEEGFALVVDGKAKSHYDNAKAATDAGLALKRAYPVVQVVVYDAVEKSRTLIELPAGDAAAKD